MAAADPLSYDEIHSIQRRERSTRSLTKIPHDFYERLAMYLEEAKQGLDEESARGASPRLLLLQGQFRNLQDMGRDILLMRLRKVTEMAFTVFEGGALNEKVLSAEELAFVKDLGGLIERTRATSMRDGVAPAPPAPSPAAPAPAPTTKSAAPAPPPSPKAHEPPPAGGREASAVVLLRILDDIPPFEGDNNRVYHLKREDVVTLPSEVARILVRRRKAVELEVPP